MPQPTGLEDPLLQAYANSWAKVVQEQESLVNDPLRAARARRLAEMRARIETIMDELDDIAASWIRGSLSEVYGLGAVTGVSEASGGVGQFAWSQIHEEAVQKLATGMYNDLLGATKNVKYSTKATIRAVARDQGLRKAIEGRSPAEASREMRRVLESKGIFAVTYSDGSKHGLKEYSQMVTRTTSAIAYNEGTLNGAAAEGVKYWEVFDGPSCGWASHDDTQQALGRIVTKDEALGHPISHPNCRRAFGARPDVTTKEQAAVAQRSVTEAQTTDQRAADAGKGGVPVKRLPPRPQGVELPSDFTGTYEGPLFHGTSAESGASIVSNGFSPSQLGVTHEWFMDTEGKASEFYEKGAMIRVDSTRVRVGSRDRVREVGLEERQLVRAELRSEARRMERNGIPGEQIDAFLDTGEGIARARTSKRLADEGIDGYVQVTNTLVVTNPDVLRGLQVEFTGPTGGVPVKRPMRPREAQRAGREAKREQRGPGSRLAKRDKKLGL